MAKDISMSKCPGTESGCKSFRFGSVINCGKAITNSGFILRFDVDCSGFKPDKERVNKFGHALSVVLKRVIDDYVSEVFISKDQLDLF